VLGNEEVILENDEQDSSTSTSNTTDGVEASQSDFLEIPISWACSVCTFDNSASSTSCEMCLLRRGCGTVADDHQAFFSGQSSSEVREADPPRLERLQGDENLPFFEEFFAPNSLPIGYGSSDVREADPPRNERLQGGENFPFLEDLFAPPQLPVGHVSGDPLFDLLIRFAARGAVAGGMRRYC
jgi:rubredoxin